MDEQEFPNQEDEKNPVEPPLQTGPEGGMEQAAGPGAPDQARARATRAGIITGVALAVIAALAIVLFLDPFNLHLIDRLTGRYDAAMTAMPPDTKFYIGFDLRNVSPNKLDRVIKPFASKVEGAEIQEYEDLLKQIDEGLEQDLGITLTDDVIPWIGQYVGLGVLELDMQGVDLFGYSGTEPEVHMVVALEARNRAGADAFLSKIGDYWTREHDLQSRTLEHGGATITYWPAEDPSELLAYARVRGLVIIGQYADDVGLAIDAYRGDSLADDPAYRDLVGDLHKDRGLTMFTTGTAMGTIYEDVPAFEFAAGQFDILQGYAMTLAVVDAGLQLDIVTRIDDAQYTEEFGKPYPITTTPLAPPDLIPADSVIYLGGFSMDSFWQNYQTSLEQSGTAADVNEAIQLLSDEIGVDLEEFFTALDGDFAMAVLPVGFGPEAEPFSVLLPFDLLLMIGTSQQAEVLEMLDPLAAALGDALGVGLEAEGRGDFTIYDVYDPYMETSVFLFGAGKDHLVLTTSADLLDEAFGGGPSLATSERYQQAADALPGTMEPFLFIDVQGLVGMIQEFQKWVGTTDETEEFGQPLEALISVSVGAEVRPGPLVQVTALAILEQP
jgi:hypothetical protein